MEGWGRDAVAKMCYGVTFLFPVEWEWEVLICLKSGQIEIGIGY